MSNNDTPRMPCARCNGSADEHAQTRMKCLFGPGYYVPIDEDEFRSWYCHRYRAYDEPHIRLQGIFFDDGKLYTLESSPPSPTLQWHNIGPHNPRPAPAKPTQKVG